MPVALITGITGQDGGLLAEDLAADDWLLHGVLRPGEALPQHLAELGHRVVTHVVDLLDPLAVGELVRQTTPDHVYNLAGISSVAQSWASPVETLQVNGVAVAVLLEALWQHHREARFVQASSAELFAGTLQVPQDEDTPIQPRSPYGAGKALAHHLVAVYRSRGMHVSAALLYNHESPRRPPAFVTRKITMAAAAMAAGLQDELILGSLAPRRDWGWAPEYVEALVAAATHEVPGDYVIATGTSHTVGEFVAVAMAAAGIADWQHRVRTDPTFVRPSDAVDLVGNPSRAREVLGWVPEVGFEETVRRMVENDLALLGV